jgi:hypothetical protein
VSGNGGSIKTWFHHPSEEEWGNGHQRVLPDQSCYEFGKIFSKTLASQLSPKLAANQSIFI